MFFDLTDRGIVFSQNGTGVGEYLDVKAVSRQKEQLQSTFLAMSAGSVTNTSEPYIARTQQQEFDFRATFDQATKYTVRIVGRRDNGPWEPIQSVRSDTGAMAAEHDLVGPDAALLLQTTGGSLREQIRVEALATYLNPLTASDSLECRMRAA
jgi:hypothetical protein